MRKETSFGCTPLSIFYRYPRLMQGLSLVGGIGVLSSSLVMAQTESPIDTAAVPTPAAVAPPVEAAPERLPEPEPVPAPAARVQPATPEPIVESAAPARNPEPEPVRYSEPKPSAPIPPPESYSAAKPVERVQVPESEPVETFVQKKPALAAPHVSLPETATVAKPPEPMINPTQVQESAKSPLQPTNNYIDRTDYSIGATSRYEGPASVVLSDRSTGCQTVSQNGQLSSGVCGVAAPSQPIASQPIAGRPIASQPIAGRPIAGRPIAGKPIASLLTAKQPIASLLTLKQPTVKQSTAGKPILNQPIIYQPTVNAGGILQEPRLGGVLRLPTPPVAGVQSGQLGLLKAGNSGSARVPQSAYAGYSSELPVVPTASYYSSATGSATPMGLSYYNLTTRPAGRPSIGQASFMFPLTIPAAITSLFGWRVHPITGEYRFHAGTDLGAPQGTPVIAAATGQVATADFLGGYGLAVILLHEKGTQQSLYAHLSEIFVQPGQSVEQGTVIGRVGSTGNSTGPHLHFEWRHLTSDGWVAVDAGAHLEYALAQFVRALQVAQATPQRGL
ncbi:MAG TPA: M23 family metallopeptidase [Coleofasciculaceae cyanobacterium]